MSEKRKRGFLIEPEAIAVIEQKMAEKGYNSREKLAEAADYLSIDTVNRLFRGEKTQRKTIEAIAKALDLKPTDLIESSEWFPASSTAAQEKIATSEINIDWREVCHTMLKEQQDKQRLRRQATEMGFEVNVHVPLGLVERKQQQRRDGNVERNQLYPLDREVIAKTYQHDEFLTEVIGQRQARKNKHIAIVGEPGAGKTTLLGAIASFIQSNTEDLPICISLASLQGKTLEHYLLKTWLSEAMGLVNPEVVVTPEIENEVIKQFRKGGVWLLLDGVDEMGADSPVQALATIEKQVTDWFGQARVVLTCRLNVWDASVNNILTGFDTYRTQEFTHEQIDQFIQEWFSCAEDAQRGEQLQAKLKETGRERIRDLVKNPLRLALLCQIFYLDKSGDLPETKAAVYERFTRYFYEWKQELHPRDLINQDELKNELHQALGKLALAGINSKAKFRLKQSLAHQEMGEGLFNLACNLGWLNLVERDAETDEPVYTFFHANFQEYFAALNIDDWHYFLNHIPYNPRQGVYRVFQPQWKEVILLWFGHNEEKLKEQKEQFIQALVEFEDGWEDFYHYRAYFLASACIAEFEKCSRADAILTELATLYFGKFNSETQDWDRRKLPESIEEEFVPALAETNCKRVSILLVEILHTTIAQWKRTLKISSNLARNLQRVSAILGDIDPGNSEAVALLVDFLQTTQCEIATWLVVRSLGQIGGSNPKAIAALIELLHTTQSDFGLLHHVLWSLGRLGSGNSTVINALVEFLHTTQSGCTECTDLAERVMRKIGSGNSNELLFNQAPPASAAALIERLSTCQGKLFVANNLKEIPPNNLLSAAVASLKDCLQDEECYEDCYAVLWYCAQNMSYPDFYEAWHSQPTISHPEAPDNILVGNSSTTKALENQFTDIASQLQPTDKTYPIVINTQTLEGETDTSAIAQELCNQIYLNRFPDNPEIPEVSNAPQLKRLIPQIKKQLQKQNLALIVDKCEPNQELVSFCRKLTDVLHIAWFTEAPLEPPLRGFPPAQSNLLSALQTWLNEIG
jgi:energy-coupling factor transporter ATP-binding protein EcfA2/DNA-binding Xre family transcriptional regulator